MGLKGYRLWVMGQLDSNVQSPTTCPCRGGRAVGGLQWLGAVCCSLRDCVRRTYDYDDAYRRLLWGLPWMGGCSVL
jgi:hypothetical protein